MAELQIIYEDPDVLILNKPSGIHSAKIPGSENFAIADLLMQLNPEFAHASEKPEDAGLINRLDFETSGILLVAKNRSSWSKFRDMIKSGGLHKKYLALIEGELGLNEIVSTYIGSPNRRAKKVRVYPHEPHKRERALPAETEFETVTHLSWHELSLVRAIAQTGRRHQIRAHAAFIKHPLVGDSLYGSTRTLPPIDGVETPPFILHAHMVRFEHPILSKEIEIEAPYPTYLSKML